MVRILSECSLLNYADFVILSADQETSPTSYGDSSDEEEEAGRGTIAAPSSSQPFQRKHEARAAPASGIEPKSALVEGKSLFSSLLKKLYGKLYAN